MELQKLTVSIVNLKPSIENIMENQEKLKEIAARVLEKANYQSDDNVESDEHGSVIAVIMVISVMLTLIRIIQECNKDKDKMFYANRVRNFSVRRGWFTKMKIKRVLRRELKPEDYKKNSASLVNAILDEAATMKEEDLIALLEASNV